MTFWHKNPLATSGDTKGILSNSTPLGIFTVVLTSALPHSSPIVQSFEEHNKKRVIIVFAQYLNASIVCKLKLHLIHKWTHKLDTKGINAILWSNTDPFYLDTIWSFDIWMKGESWEHKEGKMELQHIFRNYGQFPLCIIIPLMYFLHILPFFVYQIYKLQKLRQVFSIYYQCIDILSTYLP